MKAAQIDGYGGSEVIKIRLDVAVPKIEPKKVLVDIFAAGVNPSDWKLEEGIFGQTSVTFPLTLGGDFSGVIRETGEGVTGFKKGDTVFGQASPIAGGSGSFAEVAVADSGKIAPKPKNLSHVEAAALPLAGVAAWQGVAEHLQLKSGQKILIHGGAGGIGTFAIEMSKHLGAYVATTVSSNDIDYVKELGVDTVIDYKKEDFSGLLEDYDAVFDTVGGETYKKSFQILKPGGRIVSILEKPDETLMKKYEVEAISEFAVVTTDRLAQIAKLVEPGVVNVRIDKIFPLSETREAIEYQKNIHPRGKIVIEIKKM